MVLGKPSRMKPFLHSWLLASSSLIMLTMISSDTSLPWSMIFLASNPKGVFCATCERSMSPVARWQAQNFSLRFGAWVPFPAPGGPMSTILRAAGNLVVRPALDSKALILFSSFSTDSFSSSTDIRRLLGKRFFVNTENSVQSRCKDYYRIQLFFMIGEYVIQDFILKS
ncbi:hypothetical protein OGATHE_004573 [Ogataea polymorpha]|uniref:Secreted protein n=1 Tax=Ogataea polymorpha TaxID=460523 RepID=A0A9P8P189_9ASCO|nr:hypothetical protein OGATHE_004573 [Ogataea polymorpha]